MVGPNQELALPQGNVDWEVQLTGPVLVTPDAFPDPEIGCALGGETMQLGRSPGMLFNVPTLVAWSFPRHAAVPR